jgi:hypothetical protein
MSQFKPGMRFRFVSNAKNPININTAAQMGNFLLSEALSSSVSAKLITNDQLRSLFQIIFGSLEEPLAALRRSYKDNFHKPKKIIF